MLVPVASGGAALALHVYQRRRWIEATREAASLLGIEWERGGWRERAYAAGIIRGAAVRIRIATIGAGRGRHSVMRISIESGDAFGGLRLKREGMFSGLAKLFTGEDIELETEEFDSVIHVTSGNAADAVSRLGRKVRDAAMKAIAGRGGELSAGGITIESRRIICDPRELERIVRELLALVAALEDQPRRIEQRLLLNATKDPSSGFRARNLKLLIDRYPKSAEATEALRAGLTDRSASVRLCAARAVGERGLDTLLNLAFGTLNTPDVRLDALLAIGPLFLSARKALDRATEAEVFLIALLADRKNPICEKAARALAFCGSRDAIAALLPCTKGMTTPAPLKASAQEAIARIQTRVGGEGGRLSLTEPSGGELSLEDSEGALSVSDGGESPAGAINQRR